MGEQVASPDKFVGDDVTCEFFDVLNDIAYRGWQLEFGPTTCTDIVFTTTARSEELQHVHPPLMLPQDTIPDETIQLVKGECCNPPAADSGAASNGGIRMAATVVLFLVARYVF
jgi:hypothetical protein